MHNTCNNKTQCEETAMSASRRPAAAPQAKTVATPKTVPRAPARAVEAGTDQPLYLRIADDLTRAIAAGRYPVGSHLPTELELCEQFGISRFTAREAVRVLSSAGLITRRQRVGTVVVATPGEARYRHDATTVRHLLKYAQDTELGFVYIGKLALSAQHARDFGVKAGDEWVYAMGIRREARGAGKAAAGSRGVRAICITRLFLNPSLKGIETRLRERKTAVYALIEREYKVVIQRVEQELHAVLLDAEDAANLGVEPGAPGLRIVRRYYSDRGVLLEVADNVHPGSRFSYRMELRK
jgi:DNA-binding GntR family transcriptional regulator